MCSLTKQTQEIFVRDTPLSVLEFLAEVVWPTANARACQETKTVSKRTPLRAPPVLRKVWNKMPAQQNTRNNVSINVTICIAADIIRQQSPLAGYSDT